MISFRQLNLLQPRWPLQTRFDAIFCRNVMIYFDKATQLQVLQRLAQRLKPDGLLFAGHSENFTQARELFELQGKTVYRLARAGPLMPPVPRSVAKDRKSQRSATHGSRPPKPHINSPARRPIAG